ncbi:MAG TPA: amidohydrolase family protein [Bryobacteraceae bacterium]|nr:amidohydrolase family protein [Bryobacteraceae bacterium]
MNPYTESVHAPSRLEGNLILPDRIAWGSLTIADGRIVSVDAASVPRPGEPYIAPGFIDLHVHGGDGADYMDGTPDRVRTANRAHLRHGTTTIFPTTTTGSPQQIRRMIEACDEVRQNWTPRDGARIAGVHLYGPYFAEDKVGCHSAAGRRDPRPEEYDELLANNIVRIATCAAELPGAQAFYRAASARGCLVTCGHSNASWSEMVRAFDAGVRHVDHFWCAMSSVASLRTRFGTPMQASMEQFVLASPEMSTEVIADGCHLSPELLEFAFGMKGASRLCLVTDSNRALNMPPGRYRFGPEEDGSWCVSDGRVGRADDGDALASSVAGLDTMVRTMRRDTSATLPEIIRMASLTPAERAGIAASAGSLEPGKRADVLILTPDLMVQRVLLGGVEAF